ncbi:hypothetical protein [Janthinobacterium sp.]|uniref:hypothetical protein n=1 Tax=Janthinobacterium sp. TaxID=1871054 RepID=UPI002587BD76|nr:hypothetical protein [Janthinobacterium sp.]MCX7289772.1 hypothetical protein [Janthinobacterium sp.]
MADGVAFDCGVGLSISIVPALAVHADALAALAGGNRAHLQTSLPAVPQPGFAREDVLRQGECLHGVFAGLHVHALLQADFRPGRAGAAGTDLAEVRTSAYN